jgi:hypothetical protein
VTPVNSVCSCFLNQNDAIQSKHSFLVLLLPVVPKETCHVLKQQTKDALSSANVDRHESLVALYSTMVTLLSPPPPVKMVQGDHGFFDLVPQASLVQQASPTASRRGQVAQYV